MAIVSIQSHVAYGYVGNKAATFPLQYMGYDVCPINTVQFSNHTGYGKWTGDIFSCEHIREMICGVRELGIKVDAVLSGYMGSRAICMEVVNAADIFKSKNSSAVYLCDPVMGGPNCFVKSEVQEFFIDHINNKSSMIDIITPNQLEAEMITGVKINTLEDVRLVLEKLSHIDVVVITGVKLVGRKGLSVLVSDGAGIGMIDAVEYNFPIYPNGTGDLFSALFLGHYLKSKDPFLTASRVVYLMDLVMRLTFPNRELKIIGVDYLNIDVVNLPTITMLSRSYT